MKSATKKIKWLLPLLLIGGMFTACQDRGEEPQSQEQMQEEQPITPTNLDTDVVEQVYDGEVAVLGSSSADFMPYFLKRFPNTAGSISENTAVVILDETATQGVLGNASLFETVQSHWEKNKAIGFINPSSSALNLLSKLNGVEGDNFDEEGKALIENYAFYLVKKDGNAMSYCQPNLNDVEIESIDSLTNEIITEAVDDAENAQFAYVQGRVGERAAEWLNATNSGQGTPNLRTASCGDVSYEAFTHKIYRTINVNHDKLIQDNEYGTGCGITPTEAIIELKVYAGYDKAQQRYVYDMVVSEIFDAGKSYIENRIIDQYAAYKNKYTGGNLAGVKMGISFTNIDGSDISFTEPAPVAMAGSYSTTHKSASFTVGGNLGGSAGTSGANVTGNLCFTYSPPSTTISTNSSEFPVQYTDNHTYVSWEYGMPLSNYPQIYDIQWGFNPDFTSVFDFSKKSSKTAQAITYFVAGNEKNDGVSARIKLETKFTTYHEAATPFGGKKSYRNSYANYYISLPKVNRYFDRYTPYCKAMHVVDKTEKWEDVENTLRSNVNYKVFYNENLLIGSPVKDGLNKEAGKVWESTIQSIITQFSTRNFNNEYVVGLANSKGESLKMGLYIKGKTWKLVDDINQVQLGVE